MDAVREEVDRKEYVVVADGTRVNRGVRLFGHARVVLGGKTTVSAKATLRGDLERIACGEYCFIGAGALLRPGVKTLKGACRYVPVTVGAHVRIGADAIVQAAKIGSCVSIGERAIVGDACVLSDFVVIRDGAVMAAGTVAPPYTVWDGAPAKIVDELPPGAAVRLREAAEEAYEKVVLR